MLKPFKYLFLFCLMFTSGVLHAAETKLPKKPGTAKSGKKKPKKKPKPRQSEGSSTGTKFLGAGFLSSLLGGAWYGTQKEPLKLKITELRSTNEGGKDEKAHYSRVRSIGAIPFDNYNVLVTTSYSPYDDDYEVLKVTIKEWKIKNLEEAKYRCMKPNTPHYRKSILRQFTSFAYLPNLHFEDNGKKSRYFILGSPEGAASLWTTTVKGAFRAELPKAFGSNNNVPFVSYYPERQHVALGYEKGQVKIWFVEKAPEKKKRSRHKGKKVDQLLFKEVTGFAQKGRRVVNMCFSRRGQIVTALPKEVQVWDWHPKNVAKSLAKQETPTFQKGKYKPVFTFLAPKVVTVAEFSPTGKQLAIGLSNGSIYMHHLIGEQAQEVTPIKRVEPSPIAALTFLAEDFIVVALQSGLLYFFYIRKEAGKEPIIEKKKYEHFTPYSFLTVLFYVKDDKLLCMGNKAGSVFCCPIDLEAIKKTLTRHKSSTEVEEIPDEEEETPVPDW